MMNSLTPIASLSESLDQLLQTRTGEEELVAALEVIKRRSHGLMSFVERYREVADLSTAAPRPVAVKPFLDGIERLMSATFRERRIAFASRIALQDFFAHADAELLEQAVINLLRNAVEAVEGAESPSIEIRCSRFTDRDRDRSARQWPRPAGRRCGQGAHAILFHQGGWRWRTAVS